MGLWGPAILLLGVGASSKSRGSWRRNINMQLFKSNVMLASGTCCMLRFVFSLDCQSNKLMLIWKTMVVFPVVLVLSSYDAFSYNCLEYTWYYLCVQPCIDRIHYRKKNWWMHVYTWLWKRPSLGNNLEDLFYFLSLLLVPVASCDAYRLIQSSTADCT